MRVRLRYIGLQLSSSRSWLIRLRSDGPIAAGLQEFDKNSITKVALSGSPRRRWRRTWHVLAAGVRHGHVARRDLSVTDTKCRRAAGRAERARSTERKGSPVRLSDRLSAGSLTQRVSPWHSGVDPIG